MNKALIYINVDSFGVLVRQNIVGFSKRLQASDNVLVHVRICVSSNFHLYGSKMNSKWNFLIY